eukprot:271959-Prorocentrum_minimum.AAC.1
MGGSMGEVSVKCRRAASILGQGQLQFSHQELVGELNFRCRISSPTGHLEHGGDASGLVGELNFRVMRWLDK